MLIFVKDNWSSPRAGPYGCSEFRACAEEVAYGHLKFGAAQKGSIRAFEIRCMHAQETHTGNCNGCMHAQEKHYTGFRRKRPIARENHRSTNRKPTCIPVCIDIILWGNLSCVIIYFSNSIIEQLLIAHVNFVINSFDTNGQGCDLLILLMRTYRVNCKYFQ